MKTTPQLMLIVIFVVLGTVRGDETRFSGHKDKRSQGGGMTSGLYPFPRVGRGGGAALHEDVENGRELNWQYGNEYLSEVKRQGLIPFPRVGRAGVGTQTRFAPGPGWYLRGNEGYGYNMNMMNKRSGGGNHNGGAANGGMWFGPRLGRVQKREGRSVALDAPWTMITVKDYSAPGADFNPRLGQDSSEELDEESSAASDNVALSHV